MANVPGMHRRRAAGDPVTGDEQIRTYMRRVRSSLRVSRGQRSRVVEEIENRPPTSWRAVTYALKTLGRFDLNALDISFLQWLIVHPYTSETVCDWID